MKSTEELKKEQYDAKAKLHELVEFINNEEFYTLSKAERNLVNQERIGLELYVSSLTKRIYGDPEEPDISNMIWLTLLYGMFNASNSWESTPSSEQLKNISEEGNSEELDEEEFNIPVQ